MPQLYENRDTAQIRVCICVRVSIVYVTFAFTSIYRSRRDKLVRENVGIIAMKIELETSRDVKHTACLYMRRQAFGDDLVSGHSRRYSMSGMSSCRCFPKRETILPFLARPGYLECNIRNWISYHLSLLSWPHASNICNRCEKFMSHWLLPPPLLHSSPSHLSILFRWCHSVHLAPSSPPFSYPRLFFSDPLSSLVHLPSLALSFSLLLCRPICLARPSLVQPFNTSLDRHPCFISSSRSLSVLSSIARVCRPPSKKLSLTIKAELLRTRDTCTDRTGSSLSRSSKFLVIDIQIPSYEYRRLMISVSEYFHER